MAKSRSTKALMDVTREGMAGKGLDASFRTAVSTKTDGLIMLRHRSDKQGHLRLRQRPHFMEERTQARIPMGCLSIKDSQVESCHLLPNTPDREVTPPRTVLPLSLQAATLRERRGRIIQSAE